MEGYVLDVCEGFSQDNCQGKLAQQPVYEIISFKSVVFLKHMPMADFPDFITLIESNVDDIMATLAFLPPGPYFNGYGYPSNYTFNFPASYTYDFDINPTFVLQYGTYSGQWNNGYISPDPSNAPTWNSFFGFGFGPNGTNATGEFYYSDNSGNNIFYQDPNSAAAAYAIVQEALALALKSVCIVWVWYTGPPGSVLNFNYNDFAFGIGGTVQLTSIAPPPDINTPSYGSVFKLPLPNYAGPGIFLAENGPSPGDPNDVFAYILKFGAGTATYGHGISNGETGPVDTTIYSWVRGDYGGAGGSGSAGSAGSAGTGSSDGGL